jgi:hypothetical protein
VAIRLGGEATPVQPVETRISIGHTARNLLSA